MTTTPDKIWLTGLRFTSAMGAKHYHSCDEKGAFREVDTPYIKESLLQDPEWLAANGLKKVMEKCNCDKCSGIDIDGYYQDKEANDD